MKKMVKKGIAILIIGLIAITATNVYAQSTITVDKKTYLYSDSQRQTKFHTTKGYAYCITPNRTGPDEGRTLTFKSKQSSGGVLYLLDKAGTSDNEYLATQLAVWLYDSNHMSEYWRNHSELEVVKKAKSLAAEAAKNSNYTHTPRVRITASSDTLAISGDNKYYRSGVITVSLGYASETTLSLEGAPAGATIVDYQFNPITKAANNAKIYVQIPEDKVTKTTSFTIKAVATGKIAEVERYTTGDSNIQELVVLVKSDKTVTSTIKLSVTPVKRSCEEVNGKYYDKNGKVVDKNTYIIECEKPSCKQVGDKYLGKNGTVVTHEEFIIQCEKPSCKQVGDKYLGINGTVVTHEEYIVQCEKPVCTPVGDKYLGKNGTVVTHEEFINQCSCMPLGNKYLGKNGTEVTHEEYIIQCKKPTCDYVDNMYFGENGTRVSEEEYIRQCIHKCEVYGNKYYGSQGTVVTEAVFKSQCTSQIVPVPDTATSGLTGIGYLLAGAVILGTSIGIVTYKKEA